MLLMRLMRRFGESNYDLKIIVAGALTPAIFGLVIALGFDWYDSGFGAPVLLACAVFSALLATIGVTAFSKKFANG